MAKAGELAMNTITARSGLITKNQRLAGAPETVSATCLSSGTHARAMRSESLVQLSGKKSRRPTITGTSRDANVSETSD